MKAEQPTRETSPSRGRRTREEGQTMAEYALVLTVISAGLVAAFTVFGADVGQALQSVVDVIP